MYLFYKFILTVNLLSVSLLILQINESNGISIDKSIIQNYVVIALKYDNWYEANLLAYHNGYKLIKKIPGFKNIYIFEKIDANLKETPKRSSKLEEMSPSSSSAMNDDSNILWISEQRLLQRTKRDFLDYPETDDDIWNTNTDDIPIFNDELWTRQWYMFQQNDTGNNMIFDLNVIPVYKKGITGKGVRVAVLDDGLEYDHDDLKANYNPDISWDCNNDTPDPYPNQINQHHHGTRCAGEIAMMANNQKCGVGIAFNAEIGGIKLLAGDVFDLIEGMALGFAHDKLDIYSSSWGPTDDGVTLDGPGIFATEAIKRGINEGRNGLGSIYVWASGNGGGYNDNCNCDGYAGSIYTITVGSITQKGNRPWYSEGCSALMTVTYSSGATIDQKIATTDIGNKCTIEHTGTSASAPLVAGIIALGLEANPYLSWRDIQHIIVMSSQSGPLILHPNWQINAAGYYFHPQFGFGLISANVFVNLAENWNRVPAQLTATLQNKQIKVFAKDNDLNHNMNDNLLSEIHQKFIYRQSKIKFLEHIEVTVNLKCQRRGNIEIFVRSPSKTNIQILHTRKYDNSTTGFENWTLMSVGTWGENPYGQWLLIIRDINRNASITNIRNSILKLYGTALKPNTNF